MLVPQPFNNVDVKRSTWKQRLFNVYTCLYDVFLNVVFWSTNGRGVNNVISTSFERGFQNVFSTSINVVSSLNQVDFITSML